MAMAAWSAKVVDQLDLFVGERFDSPTHQGDYADWNTLTQQGTP